MSSPYYGKFRGVVVSNADTTGRGRIQVSVSDVAPDNITDWAEPCIPFAGRQAGMWCVPDIGASVWVEYEQGDPNRPIWAGCRWGDTSEAPSLATGTPAPISHVVIQTSGQNTIMISDAPGPAGGILLKSNSGGTITINDTGITITNGTASIALQGASVMINNNALVVT
ncbi:phage baseplate assembly protein V [Arthrobacter sp. B0490]|uniref:phage baseplate assembly protein V n=1 Tax=Arthrobacter sp. B0490 TaxID=2058891 RepID=UPI000CE3CC74|nr:phage baseplate assembly protein V [Arthrobacter sp. B0490]